MLSKIYSDLDDLGSADGYLDEIMEIRDQIGLFDGYSMEEVKVICRYMQCYAAPRNYPLLEAGMRGSFLLLLLTGAAQTCRHIPGIGIEKVADILPGAVLGETSIADGKPHLVNCITTLPADVAVLTRNALDSLLLQDPRLGNKLLLTLLEMLADRLRETSHRELPSAVV